MIIRVEAEARPTEDLARVRAALENVVEGEVAVERLGEEHYLLVVETADPSSLSPLREIIMRQQVEPAVEAYLRRRIRGREIEILLHKQAAYAGKISLIDSDQESPLGPIRITAQGTEEELEQLIKYLTTTQ